MSNSSVIGKVFGLLAAVLLGGLFFNIILGVFGLRSAISGLLVFILGAVIIFRVAPAKATEL